MELLPGVFDNFGWNRLLLARLTNLRLFKSHGGVDGALAAFTAGARRVDRSTSRLDHGRKNRPAPALSSSLC